MMSLLRFQEVGNLIELTASLSQRRSGAKLGGAVMESVGHNLKRSHGPELFC